MGQPARVHPVDELPDGAALARDARATLTRVGPAVLAAVRSVLGRDAPDVDDVAQESLVAFLRALPEFRGDCDVRSFATGIAVNVALSARRRAARRAPKLDQFARDNADPQPRAGAHDALLQARRTAALRELLDEVPREQAEAMLMRCVLGDSLPEIAAATGTVVNTVRSRIRLARQALAARIGADPTLRELFEVEP
jgi:RNA polymerase sigma-70 factor (ECF subfamily)